jgi:hypothetical protein
VNREVTLKIKAIIAGLFISLACTTEDTCYLDCPEAFRVSALCKDGTTSDSTGANACSGHGGIDCWECAE